MLLPEIDRLAAVAGVRDDLDPLLPRENRLEGFGKQTMVVGDGAAPVRVTSILRTGAARQQALDERAVGARPAQDRDRLRGSHPT